MAVRGDLILPSDMISWYEKLNSNRTRFGLTAVTVPASIAQGNRVTAEQMNSLNASMKQSVADASSTGYGAFPSKDYSVGKGQLILASFSDSLTSFLSTWDSVCYNKSVNSDYGDRGNNSNNNSNCPSHDTSQHGNTPGYDYTTFGTTCTTDKTQVSRDSDVGTTYYSE